MLSDDYNNPNRNAFLPKPLSSSPRRNRNRRANDVIFYTTITAGFLAILLFLIVRTRWIRSQVLL